MFTVSDQPIDIKVLTRELENHSAGAFVAFEGRVRKQNDGRPVGKLEYELFPELCIAEGERILAEARELFPILDVRAQHRYGILELGESAVWVGVVTAHRAAAFQAVRFIIDSIKSRCPIWKKETYLDGPSEWVGCPSCEHHAVPAPKVFARQSRIVGEHGQKRLKKARVAVIGLGGLGCPSALNLAAAGVGHLRLIDGDRVDATNLHRQTLYSYQDLGSFKVQLAKRRLEELHPFTEVSAVPEDLDRENTDRLLEGIDLILDCTDNFAAKYLLNDQAVRRGIPFIQASIYQNQAQLMTYKPEESACLRCLRPIQPPANCVESCADSGVLGAATSIVGSYQALEAIRYLLGQTIVSAESTVYYDLETMENLTIPREKNPDCPVCANSTLNEFIYNDDILYSSSHEGTWHELRAMDNAIWIDIREPDELSGERIPGSLSMPLSSFDWQHLKPFRDKDIVLFCQKGMRSQRLLTDFKGKDLKLRSLKGGVEAISHQY